MIWSTCYLSAPLSRDPIIDVIFHQIISQFCSFDRHITHTRSWEHLRSPICLTDYQYYNKSVEQDVMPSRVLCWWGRAALIETDRGHEQRGDTIMASHTIHWSATNSATIYVSRLCNTSYSTLMFLIIYHILQCTAFKWIFVTLCSSRVNFVDCLVERDTKGFPYWENLDGSSLGCRVFSWTIWFFENICLLICLFWICPILESTKFLKALQPIS